MGGRPLTATVVELETLPTMRFTMENVQIAQLWKRATESDAPAWLSELILEIKGLQARLAVLEQENATLAEQLAFYRSRVAA